MNIHATIEEWQKAGNQVGLMEFMREEDACKKFPHEVAPHFIPIGTMESELLCVDRRNGEVLLLEHEVAGRIFCRCALTQDHLVAALVGLKDYFRRCVEIDGVFEDEQAGLEAIRQATDRAGGAKYAAVYHALVGY